jgi:beta-galactosidase
MFFSAASPGAARTVQRLDFAPQEGFVKAPEKPLRQERCLNGAWRFQPVPIPRGYEWDKGIVPELPPPAPDQWEPTPIKIPSPWNANDWGGGPKVGPGTHRPYGPDSVYYPSYPERWIHVHMAWLERRFRVPADWPADARLVLHFESVAGECQIWVNEHKIGTHFDKYLPFDVDTTDAIRRDGENTVRVGVRSHRLFDKRDTRYSKMTAPYPNGSNTDRLTGIWQDVSLLSLPAVRVADVFVKPWLDRDTLEADVTVRNDTDQARTVTLAADTRLWINEAAPSVRDAPVPTWRLGGTALTLPEATLTVPAHGTAACTLAATVGGRLKPWSPDAPNLHALLVSVSSAGPAVLDQKIQRFGWRQFTLQGRDLLLNGQRIQLRGDIIHPFGAYVFSRRFAWAWYTMIKDMHGNAVRPHAQPYPRCYLELADEMGLCVLDETAVFGSSIRSNFADPAFWTRYADHYRDLILRDRNSPSVMGWSFGNEMFAVFQLNKVDTADAKRWYDQLAQTGLAARQHDPTRPWISCDGDGDLSGALPVWSKHYGHNLPPLAADARGLDKPLMVGESGGTYYARPADLAPFAGERAFLDYAGRNDALAVDLYQNIVTMARPNLAYFSASETVWFGLEHLPFGVTDFTRVPPLSDGVFFEGVPGEGKFGMQVERLPPYTGTLNPGFDPALPLYKPLAMFEAQKAAQDPRGPQPCRWDRFLPPPERPRAAAPTHDAVACAGDGVLRDRLIAWGVRTDDASERFLVLNGGALPADAKARADAVLAKGGTVLAMVDAPAADTSALSALLPAPVTLTARTTTALERGDDAHPWAAPFGLADLYFAEEERETDRRVMRHGLGGPFVKSGRVALTASRTDWSLFNRRAEEEKVGALFCCQNLLKPEGAALVTHASGNGTVAVCAIDWTIDTPARRRFWQQLFTHMGVRVQPAEPDAKGRGTTRGHDLLLDGPSEAAGP